MEFTVEVYKDDKRVKRGRRFIHKIDVKAHNSIEAVKSLVKTYPQTKGYHMTAYETWVTRKHLISGELFKERYDTPYYCSPSSETYWSM